MATAFNQQDDLGQLQVGQLVKSRAGRDLGCYYLIYRLAKNRVWLVDGRGRNPANPKAKNPRHLQRTNLVAADFVAKLPNGELTPEDIRAALNALLDDKPAIDQAGKQENPDEEALANVES